MIPIEDENPTYERAWVVYWILALNFAAFLLEILVLFSGDIDSFILAYGAVPRKIMMLQDLHTLFTSMFLHAGLLHLLGNMLFLYIFGNNIEDVFGRKRFAAFYLMCGIAAALTQTLYAPQSDVPVIGASGAVAGVLGAYLYIYPKATVKTVLVIGFPFNLLYHLLRGFARLPAYLLIAAWLLVESMAAYGAAVMEMDGGVAYAAHVGGFLTGLLLTKYFSVDLDLARKKQDIYEKICARELLWREKKADPLKVHEFLTSMAEAGETTLMEAADKMRWSVEETRQYASCARNQGFVHMDGNGRNPKITPTEKCLSQYGERY